MKNRTSAGDIGRDAVAEEVATWFLMGNSYTVPAITVVYLLVVLRLGPHWMKDKQSFSLRPLIIAYNALLVLFNLWIFVSGLRKGWVSYLTHSWCEPFHRSDFRELETELHRLHWWYFITKVIEVFETVFFVLRKKQSQVSFLHVYHHAVMILSIWWSIRYFQAEQVIVVTILNTFIHVLMYSYYMMSALGPEYQKYLWWKKYMTAMQLVQFIFGLSYHLALLAYGCDLPKPVTYLFIAVVTSLFVLFSMFYRTAYKSKSPTQLQAHKSN